MKVSIIIPARNEADNLPEVLRGVKAAMQDALPSVTYELIVIDGHSKDQTRQIAESMGAQVVLDDKMGKGAAIRKSGALAQGEILLFLDADWSHNPYDIPLILSPLLNGDADHVSGSRMLGGSDELFSSFSEFVRMVGSEIITLSIGKRFGARLTDSQNGFRALLKSTFMDLELTENITTIEQEMVVETLRRGYRLIEVPAHEYRRHAGQSSIRIWRVGIRYVWCLIRNLMKPTVRKLPKNLPEIQEKYRPRWKNAVSQ